jgi:hypothetical protein
MSRNRQREPWDKRLTDRWARQAREAANDPERFAQPAFAEQVRSPYYWISLVCIVGLAAINFTEAGGWIVDVAGGLLIAVGLVGAGMERNRRRRSRSQLR